MPAATNGIDWAAWIGALSTLGALLAAMGAGYVAQRIYKIESARDAEARKETELRRMLAEAEQASQVSVWFTPKGNGETGRVYVRNSSQQPIYGIRAAPVAQGIMFGGGGFGLPYVIPPGTTIDGPILAEVARKLGEPSRDSGIRLRFRDAAARTWSREIDGTLTFEGREPRPRVR